MVYVPASLSTGGEDPGWAARLKQHRDTIIMRLQNLWVGGLLGLSILSGAALADVRVSTSNHRKRHADPLLPFLT